MRRPRSRRTAVAIAGCMALSCESGGSHRLSSTPAPPLDPGAGAASSDLSTAKPLDLAETLYDGGYKGWVDWGWSKHDTTGAGPARIDFSGYGGWILAKPGFEKRELGSLVFRVRPPEGDALLLAVKVIAPSGDGPEVEVTTEHRTRLGAGYEGWDEVRIPLSQLDPDGLAFDRVVIRAARPSKAAWTLVDKVGFLKPGGPLASATHPPTPVAMTLRCSDPATRISPLIYGIAYNEMNDSKDSQWLMGATARRWGGNPTSRYNWQIDAWNLDSDWFFENKPVPSYAKFLSDDASHGVKSALTVPMLGWVAKDTSSVGYPVSKLGPQANADPWNAEAGSGDTKDGKRLPSTPAQTSVAVGPAWVKKWVQAIRAGDARSGRRSVDRYILDNEPGIWHVTHRDVRAEPLGYDELVARTIEYGTAVREADPDAVIAGPAEWGWLGYLFSGKDTEHDWSKADRKAHGDVPLIEFYLSKLREHEKRTGTRVLDVVDVHFYPQGANLFSATDEQTNALRLRSTRSLWDADYVDESWIKDTIRLLPRMKEWVGRNYPGRGISIGEWSFSGEATMSGGLAAAEALGRFAQYGVDSAYYWTFPPADSPTMQAFVAYRNFDGKGGRFLDWFVPGAVAAGAPVSLFASRDEVGQHVVAVALNLSPDTPLLARVDAASCGSVESALPYVLARGSHAITAAPAQARAGTVVEQVLPPYSITILDLHLAGTMTGKLVTLPTERP
jgi:hypothetical protein